jgi:hypothetical protein
MTLFIIIMIFVFLYIKIIIKKERKKKLINEYKKKYYLQEKVKPTIYKNNNLIQDGIDLCPICLQNFISGVSKIFITNCKHVFHFYCFKKHILFSSNCECPVCKFNFFTFVDEKKINIDKIKPIKLDENDNPEFEINKQNLLLKENNSKSKESVVNLQDASINIYNNLSK